MYTSVVITTYNRCSILKKCLDAVSNQTVDNSCYEVIVVDDCSTDETEMYMKQAINKFVNLKYIRNKENVGLAASRNMGIDAAKGEIVLFIDDDIIVDSSFVKCHVDCHKKNNESIAVMSNLRFATEITKKSNFARYLESQYVGYRYNQKRHKLDYNNMPPRYLGCGIASIRYDDLIKVGKFNTNFRFWGCEDLNMGYKLHKNNTRIIFLENAIADHFDNVSVERHKQKTFEAIKNFKLVVETNPDVLDNSRMLLLFPIDHKNDSRSTKIKKYAIKVIINSLTTWLLEKYARHAGHNAYLYIPYIYPILIAGWYLRGFESNIQGRFVDYK